MQPGDADVLLHVVQPRRRALLHEPRLQRVDAQVRVSARALVGIGAAVTAAWACDARAQDVASAKALFDQGLAAMQAGDYEAGCPSLEASYKLDQRLGTLFTLAECEAKWGHTATALARYDNYVALVKGLPPEYKEQQAERVKIAAAQEVVLRGQVPELTLSLPAGAPPSTLVRKDGIEIANAAIGVSLPVDPGDHVLSTELPGGKAAEVHVTIQNGEERLLALPMPPPAPRAASSAPSARRIGSYVAFGVGGVGLLLGAVTGGLAIAKKSVITRHCDFPSDPYGCDDVGARRIERRESLRYRGARSASRSPPRVRRRGSPSFSPSRSRTLVRMSRWASVSLRRRRP